MGGMRGTAPFFMMSLGVYCITYRCGTNVPGREQRRTMDKGSKYMNRLGSLGSAVSLPGLTYFHAGFLENYSEGIKSGTINPFCSQ